MSRVRYLARRWGAIPSIIITIVLTIAAIAFWIAAHQIPDSPPRMVDYVQMRGTVYLFTGVFFGLAALVNGVLLAWTRLPWRRVAQVGSVVNIVLGVVTIPAIIGVVFIYNGVVGMLRFAD